MYASLIRACWSDRTKVIYILIVLLFNWVSNFCQWLHLIGQRSLSLEEQSWASFWKLGFLRVRLWRWRWRIQMPAATKNMNESSKLLDSAVSYEIRVLPSQFHFYMHVSLNKLSSLCTPNGSTKLLRVSKWYFITLFFTQTYESNNKEVNVYMNYIQLLNTLFIC